MQAAENMAVTPGGGKLWPVEHRERFFARADTNQNGEVSFAELTAVFEDEQAHNPQLRAWAESGGGIVANNFEEEFSGAQAELAATQLQAARRGAVVRRTVDSTRQARLTSCCICLV